MDGQPDVFSNIFMSDLEQAMDCGLTRFAEDTEFGETVDMPEGRLPFRVIQTGWRNGPIGT